MFYKKRNINRFPRVYQLEFIHKSFQTKEDIWWYNIRNIETIR